MSAPIWFRPYSIEELTPSPDAQHMGTLLDIRIEEIGPDYLKGSMPVDPRTHQPMGILHGGASVVLAETLGSVASNLVVDPAKHYGVGLEVNANHLRSVSKGRVTGICKLIHLGAKTHVWDIRLFDERGKPTCVSRLTVAILSK